MIILVKRVIVENSLTLEYLCSSEVLNEDYVKSPDRKRRGRDIIQRDSLRGLPPSRLDEVAPRHRCIIEPENPTDGLAFH
ncbi:hypothetical protein V1477_019212 [Vespula maculifrons]|uniref:Uncharacterized protein n=2 Tax=Vespula TaxID=7451 RepID=A0A834J461_VESVU|nr:hypothetical protein HZH66_014469 [Vespula vulgaris]